MRLFGKSAGAAILCLVAAAPAFGQTLQSYKLLVLDGARVKWGAPLPGTEAAVTYAVVASPRHFAGVRNCPAVTAPDKMLSQSGVDRHAFDRALKSAFATWSFVADIGFRRTEPESADILIGAQVDPRGRAYTNVEYGEAPPTAAGVRTLAQAVICFNPDHRWKIGFDGNLDVYDLRYTLVHEIGHAIGLDHPGAEGQVMGFRYSERVTELQAGDITGAAILYGPTSADDVANAGDPDGDVPTLALDDENDGPAKEARRTSGNGGPQRLKSAY